MKRLALGVLFCLAIFPILAQTTPTPSSATNPWKSLTFLEGTWEAKTQGGSAGATEDGTYTFQSELKKHILARHSRSGNCKGPSEFDCEHGDLLYVYQETEGAPLKAIYFDSEGHVIHYEVTTPEPDTAVFLSDASHPGPQFQLIYKLKSSVMSGMFQMRMPSQANWKTYLEWSGGRKQ
jgi:hypothetical protein